MVDAAYLLASAPMIIADTCIILYPQEYWRSQCCDFDALDGIIEISKTQEYSYRKGGSVKFCHISYKSATQKQKKVHNEYAHIFARALSFYHHLMFSAVESPPKMAILCSHDMSSAFLITFAILIAFFSKPTRPSCDRLAPAGVDDNPFSCSFQPLLRTWRYTRDLSKHDIKFVYSMVQINCPTCLHIPRVLLQELTKFFLSPDPVKLKERILCNSAGSVISLDTDSNGNQHHASGRDKTISSCWDNLIFELCNLNLEI